jgi:hypothetical protein
MDDRQFSQRGMVIEIKRNLLNIKKLDKGEKLRQLTFCHTKILKDSFLEYGVESIFDIHL